MHNETIKVANKIITYEDLLDIFTKMQEKLLYYQKISNAEEIKNKMLDYNYQNWTFKDNDSSLKFNVDFYDDTNIKFDNYNNFIGIFNNRLDEIKSILVWLRLSYSVKTPEGRYDYYSQYINFDIYENKANIEVSLSSSDNKIEDVYELIKNKILNAPIKYDKVIKDKNLINNITGLSIGFIPSLIISTLLLFIPSIRHVFSASYILYPICSFILAFIIGGTIASLKLDKLYQNILPEQKYAGYDSNKGKSIYKDDIDKYVETSEILIGKNINNLKCRKEIIEYYDKYKKYLPYELGIMLLISIITLFLGTI